MSHCCGGAPNTVELTVEGMSCGHCKAPIEKALSAVPGVSGVEVDLTAKKVKASYDSEKVTVDGLKKIIRDQGYEAA